MPLFGALAAGQDISTIHAVYLLPMSQGLDQYLANRLTNDRVFQVVTDPKLADAIFTDKVGKAFEDQVAEWKPKPEPESHTTGQNADDQSRSSLADLISQSPSPASTSSFGRSKGMVFLVNPKSHQVLWSVYQLPKDSTSGHLDRTASDIVSRLKRDLKPK
jgi:hypothetical protein